MSFLNVDPFNPLHKTPVPWSEPETGVVAVIAGKRCLVLDDEFIIALDIQQILEQAGATSVVCAGNGADALAAIERGPRFDLAILDVKLSEPGECLKVANALAEQGTPFIFLTGLRGEAEHTRRFPRAPIVDKPFQTPALLAAVQKLPDRC